MKISTKSIKKFVVYTIFLLGFSLVLFSCRKGIELPRRRVEIKVIDHNNQFVAGVDVSVYLNEGNFRKDEESIADGVTNEVGNFTIELEPNTQILDYYVSAAKDGADNWYDKIQFFVIDTLQVSEAFVQITTTLESKMAGRNGKRWRQTSYTFNGNQFDQCRYRLVNIFKPDRIKPNSVFDFSRAVDQYQSENSKCTDPGKFFSGNVWKLNRERDGYYTYKFDKKFIEFTETRMVVEYSPTADVKVQEVFELEQ